MPKSVESRFWDKVNKTDECWLWTASVVTGGYGSFGIGGRTYGAHRISWELVYGPISEGLCVLHKCDIPKCVRYDHLFLGTHQDNMDDMIRKGRDRKARGDAHEKAGGESNGRAKLTEEDVSRIKKLYLSGDYTQRQLANLFNVGRMMICNITKGRNWGWVI